MRVIGDFWTLSRVNLNQRWVIRKARKSTSVSLVPVPLVRGTIEHYYHFVFDLLLPLSLIIAKTKPEVIFTVNRFGPLSQELEKLFPGRVVLTDLHHDEKGTILIGMNPRGLRHLTFDLNKFSSQIKPFYK